MIAPVETVPLTFEEQTGAIRIGGSRVLLEVVLGAFDDGAAPEGIVESFSTLSLADVYSVITWYLRHNEEAQTYLKRRQEQANQVWEKIERRQGDLSALRNRIRNRRKTEDPSDDEAGQ